MKGVVRRYSGFTLIELVLALTLSAVLMAALVGLLQSVQRQLKVVRARTETEMPFAATNVIGQDLFLASSISESSGWIWLDGDFPTLQRNHPRRIGYRCVEGFDEGTSVLMRVADGHGEPVMIGTNRLVIERLDSANIPQPLSPSPTAIPNRLRVWLWSVDLDKPHTWDVTNH